MSRWIDADDAIERLGAYLMADAQIEYGGLASENIEDWKELADDILKGSPSIDIVRCRDCRRRPSCVTFEGLADYDGFCSMGERKESE